MRQKYLSVALIFFLCTSSWAHACSIFFIADPSKENSYYFGNNEDYWFDVKPFLQVQTGGNGYRRIWYGWYQFWVFRPFAQGGINEKGLLFDAAVVPRQEAPTGYRKVNYNLGDDLLATCKDVTEAIEYFERKRIAYSGSHLFFADRSGDAAILEWMDGRSVVTRIHNSSLIATNFLLSAPERGNYPCKRYSTLKSMIDGNEHDEWSIDKVVDMAFSAVRSEASTVDGRMGGTLYTVVVDIGEQVMRVYLKGNKAKFIELDLSDEFNKRSYRIPLR